MAFWGECPHFSTCSSWRGSISSCKDRTIFCLGDMILDVTMLELGWERRLEESHCSLESGLNSLFLSPTLFSPWCLISFIQTISDSCFSGQKLHFLWRWGKICLLLTWGGGKILRGSIYSLYRLLNTLPSFQPPSSCGVQRLQFLRLFKTPTEETLVGLSSSFLPVCVLKRIDFTLLG